MGRIYKPEGWSILKFEILGKPHFYKIFGSWVGGFSDPDRWRLSSGAEQLDSTFIENGLVVFPQSSGSTYQLTLGAYNQHNFYAQGVLNSLLEKVNDTAVGNKVYVIELKRQERHIRIPFKEEILRLEKE